jgi:asparagine synthase (glutamine-hydrolysing)
MPGFVGLVGNIRREEAELRVEQMLDALTHTPSFRRGLYSNEELGLYAGWVAHPGSYSDNMPVCTRDKEISLLLSGEIFTSPDQLRTLSAIHNFGESDASRLVYLYEDLGDRFYEQLNGTFSGLVADSRNRKLCLFNDRLGYDKLYHARDPLSSVFYFSSEAKALLRVLPATREFHPEGLTQFLRYGCTFNETTLYRGICLLPPASVWEFSPRSSVPSMRTYFRPLDWEVSAGVSPNVLQEQFIETFCEVLPRYFEGQLQPSLSLTGGWDTRMILAGHRVQPRTLPCYTFAGLSGDTMDVRQARKVANVAGQEHVVLRLGSDFIENFAEHAEKTVYVSDGYGTVSQSHEIYLNRLARDISPLRLTGNFGSEVIRGVTTFKEIPLRPEWFAGELKKELHGSEEQWKNARADGNVARFAVFKEIPWRLATIARLANSQLQVRTPYLDNEILRLACTYPAICTQRLPLSLVKKLRPDLAGIPTDRGQSATNHALSETFRRAWYTGTFKLDYWLSEGLRGRLSSTIDSLDLDWLLPRRHKYLDYRRWLRGPLRPYLEETLRGKNTLVSGIVGAKGVDRIVSDHTTGRANDLTDINALLTLELVHKCLLRAQPLQSTKTTIQTSRRFRTPWR